MASATSADTFPNMSSLGEAHIDGERRLPAQPTNPVMETRDLNVFYGDFHAVHDVNLAYGRHEITAMIGPSGCGKSTVLRCLNRMNDLVAGARVEGEVLYHGQDIYAEERRPDRGTHPDRHGLPEAQPVPEVDLRQHRLRPAGHRHEGRQHGRPRRGGAARAPRCGTRSRTSSSSRRTASPAVSSSASASPATIATKPDVILMDEPCSALDPIATARIEDLMLELRNEYTIIIVTHNMQQAARVSDRTAFFTARPDETTGNRTGLLVEYDLTSTIFSNPNDKRTEDYISGRFG